MKKIYTFICSLIFIQASFCQIEWQEHLSHDRLANGHLGHYVIDGKITLLMGNQSIPMNTLETIEGNSRKDASIINNLFTFRTKTTRTGVDSKEIMLLEPWDYDINGHGAFSIYEREDVFLIRNIQGAYDPDMGLGSYFFINDAFMSGGPLETKECISEGNRYLLNHLDEVLFEVELEGAFAFHEGLDGIAYQINDGVFRSTDLTNTNSVDLGTYDQLHNDPFKNQLIEMEGNVLNRYTYDDFALVRSDSLLIAPEAIQFVENGLYYLHEGDYGYSIYFYPDAVYESQVFYEMPKTDEVATFHIADFEVIGEDVYFIGVWRTLQNNAVFSYVQRRNTNNDFTPDRKDMALTSVTVVGVDNDQYGVVDYEYECTVKNLSQDTITNFTLYNDGYEALIGDTYYVKKDVAMSIAPGDSAVVNGEFSFYSVGIVTFHIVGVDYGLDEDYSNNSFTADVISSTSDALAPKAFSLSPNPSSNFIQIEGDNNTIESITIIDQSGRVIKTLSKGFDNIDIIDLPNGSYWLTIKSKSQQEQHLFIKI